MPVGTTLEESKRLLHQHKIEKLLVVDKHYHLKGLITVKDIQKNIRYPNACKDHLGRLRVGAAIGVGEEALNRAQALVEVKVDVLFIDRPMGIPRVLETARAMKLAGWADGQWRRKGGPILSAVWMREGAHRLCFHLAPLESRGRGP